MEEIIRSIAEMIRHKFNPLKIILYGSYARGTQTWDSDVDFLVVVEKEVNKRDVAVAMRAALSDFPCGKDVVIATPEELAVKGSIPGTLLYSMLKEGKVLYEDMTPYIEEARIWLGCASDDLSAAKKLLDLGFYRHACWLSAMGAERALKALLISNGIPFPRSHDLNALYKLISEHISVESLKLDSLELAKFSEWAVEAGHPGDWPAITPREAENDVASAERIVEAITKAFGKL